MIWVCAKIIIKPIRCLTNPHKSENGRRHFRSVLPFSNFKVSRGFPKSIKFCVSLTVDLLFGHPFGFCSCRYCFIIASLRKVWQQCYICLCWHLTFLKISYETFIPVRFEFLFWGLGLSENAPFFQCRSSVRLLSTSFLMILR